MKLGENWTDDKKVREFNKSVSDPDYDTEVRVHKGNVDKLVETVRKREKYLGHSELESSRKNKRTRRVKFGEDDGSDDEEPQKPKKKKNPLMYHSCQSLYSLHLIAKQRRIFRNGDS